mmetsp:Transcript_90574/g.142047  ORF Transcript_90574/g.142047 Transcript_90574/m.142047 type:complete len:161 (-) Transcript_90574:154-636(-)
MVLPTMKTMKARRDAYTVKAYLHMGFGLKKGKAYKAWYLRSLCKGSSAKLKKLEAFMKDPTYLRPGGRPVIVGSKLDVFLGRKGAEKTVGGLTKIDLVRSSSGKIVSKKLQAHAKRSFKNIKPWNDALAKAKKELGVSGFILVKKTSAVYKRARRIYDTK